VQCLHATLSLEQSVDTDLVVSFKLQDTKCYKHLVATGGHHTLLLLRHDDLSKPNLNLRLSVRSSPPATNFLQKVWDVTAKNLPVASSYVALSADAATQPPDVYDDQFKLRLSKHGDGQLGADLIGHLRMTPNDRVGYAKLCNTLPAKDAPSNRDAFDCSLIVKLQLGAQHAYSYKSERQPFKCYKRGYWGTFKVEDHSTDYEVLLQLQH
jgi:hypothetical protein